MLLPRHSETEVQPTRNTNRLGNLFGTKVSRMVATMDAFSVDSSENSLKGEPMGSFWDLADPSVLAVVRGSTAPHVRVRGETFYERDGPRTAPDFFTPADGGDPRTYWTLRTATLTRRWYTIGTTDVMVVLARCRPGQEQGAVRGGPLHVFEKDRGDGCIPAGGVCVRAV